jgi:hypothetical protein
MHPIELSGEKNTYRSCMGNGCPPDPKAKLGEFARKLGVDAVVIVAIDYCYGAGFWNIGGLGEAKMTAASTVRAVSKDGQMLIDMDDVPRCSGETRAWSEDSMFMNGGDLVLASASREKLKAMFAQATALSLNESIGKVQAAMK